MNKPKAPRPAPVAVTTPAPVEAAETAVTETAAQDTTATVEAPAAIPAAKSDKKSKGGLTLQNIHNGVVSIRGVVFNVGSEYTLTDDEMKNEDLMRRVENAVKNGLLKKA